MLSTEAESEFSVSFRQLSLLGSTTDLTMVTLFEDPRKDALATFLMQVFITLIVCKVLAKLLSFIRQPQVIGQIIAGIIFGPSVLGLISRSLL